MTIANMRDLTDKQWKALDALIPEPPRREDGRGRPWKNGACRLEWYFVGVADWCTLGRCSRPVSVIPDLPSQISAMGPLRNHERNSGSPCPRTEGSGSSGCRGSLHRRQLRSGEKRGSKIGNTKRGKGTRSWQWQIAMVTSCSLLSRMASQPMITCSPGQTEILCVISA